MIVLGEEEWENYFGNSMEITGFNGFSCESPNEVILVSTLTITKDKHGKRH